MSKLIEAAQAVVDRFVGDGYSPALIKAIWALRDALAEDQLTEQAEPITLFVWEDDHEYSKWGELRQVGPNLYERVEK